MICPVCGKELCPRTVASVPLNVCDRGCGGVWFDRYELEKMEAVEAAAGRELLNVPAPHPVNPNPAAKRPCPQCKGVMLTRHFFSVRRQTEIDECMNCGGVWLDPGELARIRVEFPNEVEHRKAAETYVNRFAAVAFADQAERSMESHQRMRRFGHLVKFLLPSYWAPGRPPFGSL